MELQQLTAHWLTKVDLVVTVRGSDFLHEIGEGVRRCDQRSLLRRHLDIAHVLIALHWTLHRIMNSTPRYNTRMIEASLESSDDDVQRAWAVEIERRSRDAVEERGEDWRVVIDEIRSPA